MTKLEEMKAQKTQLIAQMQSQLEAGDLDAAEATKGEILDLNRKISVQQVMDENEVDDIQNANRTAVTAAHEGESASFIRAAIKKFAGKKLTDKENALLTPSAENPNGENGEAYILPEDIQTRIREKTRDYRSMREDLGYIRTSALSGRLPVESFDTITGLIDFADGTDGEENEDIKFTSVPYTLSEKGALIQLSNTLLALSDNDLLKYVVKIFAKKAVVTENAMAVAALSKDKTVKPLADYKALKSSINKDLDPAALHGCRIITNQDGFDKLDSEVDDTGRPLLQPDPTDLTRKMFVGYPIKVYSNALLPTVANKAPVFYGDTKNGVAFVDLGKTSFATSSDAGFTRNTTYARMIEHVAVIQLDGSDKCYCYGQLDVTAAE